MKARVLPSLIFGLAALGLAALPARAQRSGYAHVTDVEGAGSILSDANGRTEIQVNLPLAEGDQIVTDAGGHAEIELADGNRVQIDGESRLRLDALASEDGSAAEESALTLLEGSVAVESAAFADSRTFRVDTADASVYVPAKGRARVNLDGNRGTSVIVRAGSVEVETRSGPIEAEGGQYVVVRGDDQPELARGSFSRDRFDVWVADRTETALAAYNSVSARYVDGDEYDQDVASLDDHGSWDYSPTYDTEVWRPNVGADWSPYSDGYWYYTPVGASWVGSEPWGWFPYHYGNWFFDAGFGSWCWSPAFAYSPAWVYWGFAPGYVGWCPIGSYAYYGPYSSYWGGYGGWHSGLYFGVHGTFDGNHVDWRHGWNFVGDHSFGSHFDHRSVMPGSAVASRLGSRVAITSDPVRPAMISGRGSAVTALRSYARTAPETIARQSSPERSAALAPFLARQAKLPAATVRVLQDTQLARVNPSSRRLEGPGAARLAASPRENSASTATRSLAGGAFRNPGGPRTETWREPQGSAFGSSARSFSERTVPPSSPRSGERAGDWRRSSSGSPRSLAPRSPNGTEAWRARSSPRGEISAPRSERPGNSPAESWRVRANTPPAQRVIEGIDRGRANLPPGGDSYGRPLPERRSNAFESRGNAAPYQRYAPPGYGRESAPPAYGRPAPPDARRERSSRNAAPAPHYAPSAPPPAREYRAPSPPPRQAPPPPRSGNSNPPQGRSR